MKFLKRFDVDPKTFKQIENVHNATWYLLFTVHKKTTIVVAILSILLIVLTPIMTIVLAIGYIAVLHSKARKVFIQQFALANGLTYKEMGVLSSVSGRLFSAGHSRKIYHVTEGDYQDHPLRLFNYQYTVGHGKNSQTYSFTIVEISFEKTDFPFILLQAKSMSRFMFKKFGNKTKDTEISLEPEFKKTFRLFCTEDYEIEVLQIFTEDFLRFLVESAEDFSIEFSGNKLYIYDNKIMSKRSELIEIFSVAKKIFDSIGALLNRLHDDFDALHSVYRE